MSSDDDGDVVVMRVCAAIGCTEIHNLHFNEEAGEFYCIKCLRKFEQAEAERDFSILLSAEDSKAVEYVFNFFDHQRRGYWTFAEFNEYLETTQANRSEQPEPFESNNDMMLYIREEYDVDCATVEVSALSLGLPEDGVVGLGDVVTIDTLRQIYGGYVYHGVNALKDDLTALEDCGGADLGVLE